MYYGPDSRKDFLKILISLFVKQRTLTNTGRKNFSS